MSRNSFLILLLAINSIVVAENKPTIAELVALARKGPAANTMRIIDAIGARGRDAAEATDFLVEMASPGQDDGIRARALKSLGEVGELDVLPFARLMLSAKQDAAMVNGAAKKAVESLEKLPVTEEQRLWLQHASEFAMVAGKPMRLPQADLGGANSLRMNFQQTKQYLKSEGEGPGLKWKSDSIVRATMTELRELKTGAYGQFMGGKVLQVLGPQEMLLAKISVKGFWLDQIIRVAGVSTEGLVDGADWYPNMYVLVTGTYKYDTASGSSATVFNCIPLATARCGISFSDFRKMLAENPDALK